MWRCVSAVRLTNPTVRRRAACNPTHHVGRAPYAPYRGLWGSVRHVTRAGAGLALGAAALPAVAMPSIEQQTPIQFDNRPPLTTASSQASGFSMGDININVTPAPGMNEQQLAQYVAQELQRALTNAQRDAQARQRSSLRDLD